jgi:antitoxin YefM
MLTVKYSAFRKDLKTFLDKVNISHTQLKVTRSKGEDVVVLSKADYDSMEETFYLLKNPANARRLLQGLADFKKNKGLEKSLLDI